MIRITLQFTSIALAMAALAKIDQSAIEIVTGSTGVAPDEKAAVVAAADAIAKAKDTPAKPKGTPAAKTPPAADSQPSAAAAQTAAPAEGKKVAYPDLQKAVFALVGLAKKANLDPQEHVLGIAVGLGAATFKELPEEQWAPALAAVEAKTAELAAA